MTAPKPPTSRTVLDRLPPRSAMSRPALLPPRAVRSGRPAWAPFAGVRPLGELRAGVWRIRERWEAILGTRSGRDPRRRTWRVRTRATSRRSGLPERSRALRRRGQLVRPCRRAGRTRAGTRAADARGRHAWPGSSERGSAGTGRTTTERRRKWTASSLHGAFDLLTALEHLLPADCADFLASRGDQIPDGSIVIGDPIEVVCLGAFVEPGVVFDTRGRCHRSRGGVEVRSGTRLEGPLYVGPQSTSSAVTSGLGLRARCGGARRGVAAHLPRLRQQEPRRIRGALRPRHLGQPGRGHHHLEPQEHLRRACGSSSPATASRPGGSSLGQPGRRPRQDRHRHPAVTGTRHRRRRQPLRRRAGPSTYRRSRGAPPGANG